MPSESSRRRAARQSTGVSPASVATSTQQEICDFLPTLVEGALTPEEDFVAINDLQLYTGDTRNVACPIEGELAAKLKVLVAEAMKSGSKGKDSQEAKRSKEELKEEKKKFTYRIFEEDMSSVRPCDYCAEKGQPCTIGVYDEETKGRDSKAITILLYCATCQNAHKGCSLMERYMAARLSFATGWQPHVAYSLVRALRADRRKPSKKKIQTKVEEDSVEDLPDEQAEKSNEVEATSPKKIGSSTRKRARVVSDDFNVDGKQGSPDVRKSKRQSLASSAATSKVDASSTNATSAAISSEAALSFVTKSGLKALSAEKTANQVEKTEPEFSMPPRVRKTAHLRNLGLTPDPFVEMELDAAPDTCQDNLDINNAADQASESSPPLSSTEVPPRTVRLPVNKLLLDPSTATTTQIVEKEEELEVQTSLVHSSARIERLEANEKALSGELENAKTTIERLEEELRSSKMKENTLGASIDELQARQADIEGSTVARAENKRLHTLLTELHRGSQDACSMLSTFDPGSASSANPNLLLGEVVSRLRGLVDRTSANIGYV